MKNKPSKILAEGPFRDATDELYGEKDLGLAMDKVTQKRCCGIDCCHNTITLDDVVNGNRYVGYSKNGSWQWVTEATYEADKANGFA